MKDLKVLTKRNLFLFLLCLFPQILLAQIQYQPLASSERSGLSLGVSPFLKKEEKKLLSRFPVWFFTYNLYLPEVSRLLPEASKDRLTPGIELGASFFDTEDSLQNYNLCSPEKTGLRSMAYHLGLMGKANYLNILQAFVGGGWARSLCYFSGFKQTDSPQKELSHYLSYGLFLSFQIFDRSSIYSMDQEYGINNVGLKGECRSYYFKEKGSESFQVCQLGLQVSF